MIDNNVYDTVRWLVKYKKKNSDKPYISNIINKTVNKRSYMDSNILKNKKIGLH